MNGEISKKRKIIMVATGLLVYLLAIALLTLTVFVLVRKATRDVKNSLVKDNNAVVHNAQHLYKFDVECLNYTLRTLKTNKTYNAGLSLEEYLIQINLNFEFFKKMHNSVIADMQMIYGDTYVSVYDNTMKATFDMPREIWFEKAVANPDKVVETPAYRHSVLGIDVFSYAIYDTELDIVLTVDIDCDKSISYYLDMSIGDCFLSFINGDGEVIATNRENLLGKDTHEITEGALAGFADYMDYIKQKPDELQFDFEETETFSFVYYYEEADRFIVTVYYPSDALADYGIWLVVIAGVIILVFGFMTNLFIQKLFKKEQRIRERMVIMEREEKEMSKMYEILTNIVEYRSFESGSHIKRVQHFTRVLAERLSEDCPEYAFSKEDVDNIALASTVHDIGKIAVPDNILNKPGKLTAEEFETMKTHTVKGAEIIDKIFESEQAYFDYAKNIAMYHHERCDGRGYPSNLKAEEIPIEAQIVAVADCLDALINKRCYKEEFDFDKAVEMIAGGECGAMNPKVVEALLKAKDELRGIFISLRGD